MDPDACSRPPEAGLRIEPRRALTPPQRRASEVNADARSHPTEAGLRNEPRRVLMLGEDQGTA